MKIKVYVATNRVGSKVEHEFEIDDSEFDGLNETEREQLINEYAHDEVFDTGMFEWGWEETPAGCTEPAYEGEMRRAADSR